MEAERLNATNLLRRAAELFDARGSSLAQTALAAGKGGFSSGGRWMGEALGVLRGTPPPFPERCTNVLGMVKYGLASGCALLCVAAALWFESAWLLLLIVPVFYAVEAQLVFLFPLVLDGSPRPFRDAWQWTRFAGGTWAVMRVVLPIAAVMLFGGFVGRGFIRCWCLGCLAICLWYEDLRVARDVAVTV